MPTRRRAKGFRPLGQRPAPATEAARDERALREREAIEVSRAAARFNLDRLRDKQRQAREGEDPALRHFLPRGAEPAQDEWEDDEHRPDPPPIQGLEDDQFLGDLEVQAKLIRRLRKLENWQSIYDSLFDEFLLGQERTKHWSISDWDLDIQAPCTCGAGPSGGKIRKREVVLVDLHSKIFHPSSSSFF